MDTGMSSHKRGVSQILCTNFKTNRAIETVVRVHTDLVI